MPQDYILPKGPNLGMTDLVENSTLSRALLPLYLSAGPSPQLFLPSFCRRWFFICCEEVFWLSHLTFNNSFITLSFSLSFPNAMIAPDTAIWFYFFLKKDYIFPVFLKWLKHCIHQCIDFYWYFISVHQCWKFYNYTPIYAGGYWCSTYHQ